MSCCQDNQPALANKKRKREKRSSSIAAAAAAAGADVAGVAGVAAGRRRVRAARPAAKEAKEVGDALAALAGGRRRGGRRGRGRGRGRRRVRLLQPQEGQEVNNGKQPEAATIDGHEEPVEGRAASSAANRQGENFVSLATGWFSVF